jgi:hypothetical protein
MNDLRLETAPLPRISDNKFPPWVLHFLFANECISKSE